MHQKIHPTVNVEEQDNERLNQMTERYDATMQVPQPSRFNQSKSELSKFNSEIQQSPYLVIERNKLSYIANYNRFEQMRFIENLAGLSAVDEKIQLINEFSGLFTDMCNSLMIIQTNIVGIDFDDPNFTTYYSRSAKEVIETLYKDVKTLESFHIEMVSNSSLRYFETVLEAQQMENMMINLQRLDIRTWQYTCIGHLLKFKISPYQEQEHMSCTQRLFPCFFKRKP